MGDNAMITFLLRKIWKNKWLVTCLLVGNILLIGVVSATPLYTQATMQRILQQDLRQLQYEQNQHPAIVSVGLTFNIAGQEQDPSSFQYMYDVLKDDILNTFDIPVIETYISHSMVGWRVHVEDRGDRIWERTLVLSGTDPTRYYDRINLMHGRMPSDTLVVGPNGYIIEALAMDATLLNQDLLLDELLPVNNVRSPRSPYTIQVVGIFELSDETGLYWTSTRRNFSDTLIISNQLVYSFIENYTHNYRIVSRVHYLLDPSEFMVHEIDHYLNSIEALNERLNFDDSPWAFSVNFDQVLTTHGVRTAPLMTTLWVLQVPLYVLLAFYIYMVSRQILMLEQNEIAVLGSRGVSRRQVIGVYSLQGLLIAMISMPVGIALGVVFCRLLGASSGFLYLVQRAALTVEVTSIIVLYAAAAMFLSFLTMIIPVIGFSRVNIVAHKQEKRGQVRKKSLWQRFFIDILCLIAALYGLFNFNNQREIVAAVERDVPSVDPLLFLSSSLFIIGAGLFALRLFPYLIKIIFLLRQKSWYPKSYVALIRVVRSAGEEQFIMIFLVITLAVGIFSAHAARTVNTNNEHRIQYLSGADVVFQEQWRNNIPQIPQGIDEQFLVHMPAQIVYTEPDFERFTHFDEVTALTRVQNHQVAIITQNSRVYDVQLMGIETNTFGETIWFRDDLLPIHINYFLNILAITTNGVLLSDNFRTQLNYDIGDVITIRNDYSDNPSITFITELEIVGFVEYWPGFSNVERVTLATGEVVQAQQYLAIANIGQLQAVWGMLPYQVWMRTNTDSNRFIYDFQAEHELRFIFFSDSSAAIVSSRSDPIIQGTNGVLTMSFIVTLLICFAGFMIYWVLSIRARVLQFGIYRAMGMGVKSIIGLLVNEQLLITLTAIAIGAIVGEIAARLYVPLIQMSYSAADQVIPLLVVTVTQDYVNLYFVIGIMVLVCLVTLGIYITRIKVTQALKLGED